MNLDFKPVKASRCVLLVMMLGIASSALGQVETIDARARGTSTQMGRDFDVRVNIERFSTPQDSAALVAAFQKGGNDELVKALSKMKSVGRIRIPTRTNYSIVYSRSVPTPTGRKLRFVTDRPFVFAESWNMIGEIDINDQNKDKSTGVLYPAAKLKINKDGDVDFELDQNPWQLVNIVDWTKSKE